MIIRLLEPAQAELDEAVAWYVDQAPGLGDAFLLEALRSIKLIERFPKRGTHSRPKSAGAACGASHTAWCTQWMGMICWCWRLHTSIASQAIGAAG